VFASRRRWRSSLTLQGSPAFPGTYREWRERLYKVFREAGVEMTPHAFRHFRISEWLAQGVSVLLADSPAGLTSLPDLLDKEERIEDIDEASNPPEKSLNPSCHDASG